METNTHTAPEVTAAEKMYLDACASLGKTPHSIEQYAHHEEDAQAFFSLHKITTVVKARKEGRKFDWNNTRQCRFFPRWNVAGSGFSMFGVHRAYTYSDVGARLSSESSKDSREIAETMIEDFENWVKE